MEVGISINFYRVDKKNGSEQFVHSQVITISDYLAAFAGSAS